MGMSVEHHTSAGSAYNAFISNKYDLVLTDLVLEGDETGRNLVQKIRVDTAYDNVPIIVISGLESSSHRIDLLKEGANDYVSKPVINDELMVRVQNLIKTKKLIDYVNEQQDHLRELAMKDQLTGLYNRHFLMEVGPKRIKEAYRHEYGLSLLMIDLDRFKWINDNHGHAVGDEVLSEVGALLKNHCRQDDLAARFGGEEFILILGHCDKDSANAKAEEIRLAIENLKPASLDLTASIGVASLENDSEEDLAGLFARADEAVYQSKEKGRNQVTVM